MTKKKLNSYKINWVLKDELAISRAPINESELKLISKYDIKSILSLCGKEEAPIPENITNTSIPTLKSCLIIKQKDNNIERN